MSTMGSVSCPGCGKRLDAPLAGQTVTCVCGRIVHVPAAAPVDDLLDLAPDPAPAAATPATKTNRASVNEAIRTRMGIIPGKTGETRERERLEESRRLEEERTKPNAIRDTYIPIALIAAGVCLSFYEVMLNYKIGSIGSALPFVLGKQSLSILLVTGGMFFAQTLMDVTFAHGYMQNLLRILAIAVGPCSIYGACSGLGGDLAGPAMGTFLSLIIYSILYWKLLQLDMKDTAICVLTTWIMVAGANYAIFRAQSFMMGSSI